MVRLRGNGLLVLILLVMITGCANNDWQERITFRAPTETEIREFGEQKGEILAKRLYHDHAILLGAHYIYSLYYNLRDEQQSFGTSWGIGQEELLRTAITEESHFIGIVIRETDASREAAKLKIIFDDGTAVVTALDDRQAYIIDHPLGKLTFVSKTKVQLLNELDEIIAELQ